MQIQLVIQNILIQTSTCVYIAIELQPAISRWSAMVNNTYAYEIYS